MLAASGASAQTLELLGPSGAVPPDGFTVALLERGPDGKPRPLNAPELVADGADVKRAEPVGALRTFAVAPRKGTRSVTLRAKDGLLLAEGRYEVGPPTERVELSLNPAAPVKNKDISAELTVRLLKQDGSADAEATEPVLRANVGKVEGLTKTGPGSYRAKYILPETRYPEVVVIVAFSPWPHPLAIYGAIGTLLVPLAAAIDLPGKTERNAQISVEIAGTTYGPGQAGPDGRFKLPVIVPPGHRFGTGMAVDRAGNKRTTQIDLMLPPTDQLSCVINPTRLPANGSAKARIICGTSDPFGKPFSGADVQTEVRRGSLEGPHRLEAGLLEWIYTAPPKLGESDVITATWRQGGSNSKDELAVELVQGPASKLTVFAAEEVVHFGSDLPITAAVRDSLDRPRAGAALALESSVGGTFSPAIEPRPGQLATVWTLPKDGQPGPAELRCRAYGPQGKEPAQLAAWLADGELHAGVSDLAGLPVPGQRLDVDGKAVETGADGSVRLGAPHAGKLELRLQAWPGLRRTLYVLDPQTVWPQTVPIGSPTQRLTVGAEPPIPVNVRIAVKGRTVTYWAEDPKGKLLAHRDVVIHVDGGRATSAFEKDGRHTVTIEPAGRAAPSVSVTDRLTDVTAVAGIQP